jgi:hypothetical protein
MHSILSALRHQTQLHGNLKFTALEVGHRMNHAGYGRIAYQMMAYATGYSRRTVINHMHRLVTMGIFQKTVYRLKFGNQINLYKCLLAISPFYRGSPSNAKGASVARTLPTPKTEEEKSLSLREELRRQQWAMRNLPMAAEARSRCAEEIARLEGLLRC